MRLKPFNPILLLSLLFSLYIFGAIQAQTCQYGSETSRIHEEQRIIDLIVKGYNQNSDMTTESDGLIAHLNTNPNSDVQPSKASDINPVCVAKCDAYKPRVCIRRRSNQTASVQPVEESSSLPPVKSATSGSAAPSSGASGLNQGSKVGIIAALSSVFGLSGFVIIMAAIAGIIALGALIYLKNRKKSFYSVFRKKQDYHKHFSENKGVGDQMKLIASQSDDSMSDIDNSSSDIQSDQLSEFSSTSELSSAAEDNDDEYSDNSDSDDANYSSDISSDNSIPGDDSD